MDTGDLYYSLRRYQVASGWHSVPMRCGSWAATRYMIVQHGPGCKSRGLAIEERESGEMIKACLHVKWRLASQLQWWLTNSDDLPLLSSLNPSVLSTLPSLVAHYIPIHFSLINPCLPRKPHVSLVYVIRSLEHNSIFTIVDPPVQVLHGIILQQGYSKLF